MATLTSVPCSYFAAYVLDLFALMLLDEGVTKWHHFFRPVYLALSRELFLVEATMTYILIYCVVWARETRSMTHSDHVLANILSDLRN